MFKIINISIITFLAICITSISAVKARAAEMPESVVQLSTGIDYSSGDYGLNTDTDITYIPVSLKYATLPWSFKATVPYVHITGPGGVIAGADGGIVINSATSKKTTEQGLGDIVLSASYALDTLLDTSTLIDVTAKAKIATADESKGLGTGENDYSLQLDTAKAYGNLMPFATVRYKVMGDPDGIDLSNSWFGSVGADYKTSDKIHLGMSYDYKQAVSATSEDAKEAMAYVNWKMSKKTSLLGYGVIGFSNGSPDSAIGLQLTNKL